MQRARQARRIAERVNADHVVQAKRRTVASGGIRFGRGVGKAEDLDLQPDLSKGPAEARDADPHAGGTA
jgi:hypothetical protein